jgi:hypothetical protein
LDNDLVEMSLPNKPRYGEACNGCGLCCAIQLCPVAEIMFEGASAPCPALKMAPDGSRTYCQLVAIEKEFGLAPLVQKVLGIGNGCGMEDEVIQVCTIDETNQG